MLENAWAATLASAGGLGGVVLGLASVLNEALDGVGDTWAVMSIALMEKV